MKTGEKQNPPLALFLAALLLISACDLGTGLSERKTFDYELRGAWVSNDPSVYSGELVIDFDRITVTGFSEGQTPSGEDDDKRPFKGFTKGAALKGYSEEGSVFIEDGGLLQEGIPYAFYTAGNNAEESFLRFTFGGRVETMQKERDNQE